MLVWCGSGERHRRVPCRASCSSSWPTAGNLALLHAPRHSVGSVSIVLAIALVAGLLVVTEHRSPRLGIAPVAVAIAITVGAAVAAPPRTSNDVWSYTMYGRMVTEHGTSPYNHSPADFRRDPFFERVSPRWRRRASVYGPVFVGVAALGAWVAGPSALTARLYFQLFAALALVAVLIVVWRTTRSTAAVAFLGLNPVLAVVVVNGGHNDMLIGGLLLGATLLAGQEASLGSGCPHRPRCAREAHRRTRVDRSAVLGVAARVAARRPRDRRRCRCRRGRRLPPRRRRCFARAHRRRQDRDERVAVERTDRSPACGTTHGATWRTLSPRTTL